MLLSFRVRLTVEWTPTLRRDGQRHSRLLRRRLCLSNAPIQSRLSLAEESVASQRNCLSLSLSVQIRKVEFGCL